MVNRKLSTVICLAALAFTANGVHNAYAQKGVMFTSEGGWVTKDLASSKKGAAPYCVAAMQFSKNTIMTMAENKSGEISLAFDFGGGYFDPSAVASVILDPGAGQQRSFRVKPRSSKAIVVKLGDDREFMDALARTGLLRLEIGEQSLNFNLAEIDQGRKKLNACLDGVIVVSAPNAVPPPNQNLRSLNVENSPLYANMQSEYEQKIRALESQISRKNMSVKPIASSPIAAAVTAPVALLSGDRVMPLKLPSLDDAVDKSKARAALSALQGQVGILKDKLAIALSEKAAAQVLQMKTSDMVAQEQVQMVKEKDVGKMLLAENEALKAQMAYAESRLASALEAAGTRHLELQKSYDLAQVRLRDAGADVASLQSELLVVKASGQKSVADSDLKSKAMEQKFAALLLEKQKILVLESENQQLKNKILDVEQGYKTQLSKAESANEQLSTTHDAAVVNLAQARQESGALKTLLEKAEFLQKQAETASLSDAQRLEKEFAALLKDKERAISVGSENEVLESKIEVLEGNMTQKLSDAEAKYAALQEMYDLTKANLAQAGQEIGVLEAKLVQVDVDQQKMAAVQNNDGADLESLIAARQSVVSLEAENVALRAQVESLKSSYDRELDALTSDNHVREQALRQKELEVMAIRAEAERQLAEARAVKSVRFAALEQQVAPVPSRRPAVVASVLETVADSTVSVVSQSVGHGVHAAESVAAIPQDLLSLGAVASSVQEGLPSLNDRTQKDMTQAQLMERGVIHDLSSSGTRRVVDAAEILEEGVVPVPNIDELRSVSVVKEEVERVSIPVVENVGKSDIVPLSVVEQHEIAVESIQPIVEPVVQEAVAVVTPAEPVYDIRDYASGNIGAVLQKADIAPAVEVAYVEAVSSVAYQAYEWRSENVFGSAEQSDFKVGLSFDEHVLSYLENTQSRCNGDFAIVPASSSGEEQGRVDSYEVACVGQGASSSAAIVFYEDAGKFTVVAHEAPVDNMEATMEIRDRFVAEIKKAREG